VSDLLTVEEVAERLRTSRWFVYSHGQELGLVKVGGANRYLPERVDAYIAAAHCDIAMLPVAPDDRHEGKFTASRDGRPPAPRAAEQNRGRRDPTVGRREGKRARVALLEPRPKRGVGS
jgi:hypothetical protein